MTREGTAPLALGLAVHTGWAACVVVGGDLRAPRVVQRTRIEMLDDPERFLFHRAAEGPREDAPGAIARGRKRALSRAREAVGRLLEEARAVGAAITTCSIVAKDTPMPASLDAVLSAHPRIHTAEGCFYRDVLVEAAREHGIEVTMVPPQELMSRAAKKARVAVEEVAALLARAGKSAGRPWAKDQKDAALAAWSAESR